MTMTTPAAAKIILHATDFSEPADKALLLAIELAVAVGARIEVAHVYNVSVSPFPPPLEMLTVGPSEGELKDAESALALRAEQVTAAGVGVQTQRLGGSPEEEITRRAQELGAYLVVLGSHGRSALSHALMGSVADRVVRHSRQPVLVVPLRA